ncbi:MAG: S8 family peptidase [Bacteroidetes bacterium]|nr:S8 family peptidase [Bacteroidota bacterium]
MNSLFKKNNIVIALLFFSLTTAVAQDRYVVQLKDKNNSPYSFSNPGAYLSQKSITRRANQNIAIDSMDLPVNPVYVSTISNLGATIINYSKWLNTITIQTTNSQVLADVQALSFVSSVNNVGRIIVATSADIDSRKFKGSEILTRPKAANSEKSNSFSYGPAFHQINMLNAINLHDAGFSGNGMMIAIMDAGFWKTDSLPVFDSLFAQNRIVATHDFVLNNDLVFDFHPRGTSCLSVMAANLPGTMVGIAPHVQYILCRIEDGATENIIEEYNWAAGAEFADSIGADVFSTSLGYTLFDNPNHNHSYASLDGNTAPMSIAADIAASRGIVVINSAGNEGNSPWNYISVPADANNILAVGAVDSLMQYASFSGNGPTPDGRVKPDVCALGQGTYVVSPWDGSVVPGNGTSFSGPVIAGLAACLWQAHNAKTSAELTSAIRQSASQYSNPDTLLGFGIPNFSQASFILGGLDTPVSKDEDFIINYGPNPFKDEFTIGFFTTTNQDVTVSIYDVTGKLLQSFTKYVLPIFINQITISEKVSTGNIVVAITNSKGKVSRQVFTRLR